MSSGRRHLLRTFALVTACLVAVGCKCGSSDVVEERLVVFAAASLRDVFVELGEDFERRNPGLEVSFSFAGSHELRTQIEHGAVVDVFASADQHHMDELVRAGRVSAPVTFARNEPVLVVAREAASSIRGLADLPSAARLVVGAREVPIGRYTSQILERAGASLGADFRSRVEARVVSRELNVRQVLAKVRLGEAQAGIVYRTDALTTPDVTMIDIPAEFNVVAEYPIAAVVAAPHPRLAGAWIDYVRSAPARDALSRAGFLRPADER